jgi:enamine deaminase RidA (YjgF/YER057c/UK114 family)
MTRMFSPALFCSALVLLGALLSADAQTPPSLRFINPPTIAAPRGYSHVVEVTGPGRIIYIAGQLGHNAAGKQGADFNEQATFVYENLKAALESVGGKLENIVKTNTYLTDIRTQLPLLRPIRDKYLNMAAPPVSTTVEISKLARDGALIEMEAVAVLPAR